MHYVSPRRLHRGTELRLRHQRACLLAIAVQNAFCVDERVLLERFSPLVTPLEFPNSDASQSLLDVGWVQGWQNTGENTRYAVRLLNSVTFDGRPFFDTACFAYNRAFCGFVLFPFEGVLLGLAARYVRETDLRVRHQPCGRLAQVPECRLHY